MKESISSQKILPIITSERIRTQYNRAFGARIDLYRVKPSFSRSLLNEKINYIISKLPFCWNVITFIMLRIDIQLSIFFMQTEEAEGFENQTIVSAKRDKEIYSEEECEGLRNKNNDCSQMLEEPLLKETNGSWVYYFLFWQRLLANNNVIQM